LSDSTRPPLAPRYWPVWFGLGLLWLSAQLPHRLRMFLGTGFGWLLRKSLGSRVRTARKNLELCFPEWDRERREQVLRDSFQSLGCMLFETAFAWWASDRRLLAKVSFKGTEHLLAARKQGNGLVLLAAHFTTLEMGGVATSRIAGDKLGGFYREHTNQAMEWAVHRVRERYAGQIFNRLELRGAVRHLRKGGLLWYAPDQDYRRGENLFVPFFGIQASTSTSPHHLARMGKAKVLLMSQRRLPGNTGYELTFQKAFENMPSDDPEQDLDRINQALETVIRACPEQYLWIHRRFKTRPKGEKSVY
jgi:KDO2-lipid IV(A) lauroyltransferase